MRTTKEQKIKQVKIIAEELERSLVSAVEAGADRNELSEINVFDMFSAAVEILYIKVSDAIKDKSVGEILNQTNLATKRNTKLDN